MKGRVAVRFENISDYQRRIKSILITEDEIDAAVRRAAKTIDGLYDGQPIILVSVLKGAFIFLSDLSKRVTVPCEVAFMAAKSYFEGTSSNGNVEITMDLSRDIRGCNVVIVEDIIDTGRTLKEIVKLLKIREPKSITVVALLDKPDRRVVEMEADLALFAIPDKFVIGYGLDYGEYYRNLPYIAEYEE